MFTNVRMITSVLSAAIAMAASTASAQFRTEIIDLPSGDQWLYVHSNAPGLEMLSVRVQGSQFVVRDDVTGFELRPNRGRVRAIWFFGDEDADWFFNETELKSYQFGEGGNDVLYGGPNQDVLDGGPGMDSLYGDGGDDELTPGVSFDFPDPLEDTIDGGPGHDTLTTMSFNIYGIQKFSAVEADQQFADARWGTIEETKNVLTVDIWWYDLLAIIDANKSQ